MKTNKTNINQTNKECTFLLEKHAESISQREIDIDEFVSANQTQILRRFLN